MASFLSHLHLHHHHGQQHHHDSERDSSPPQQSSCSNLGLIRSASWHHLHHHRVPPPSCKKAPPPDVPKGSLAVYVGEEQRRFVIPISYLNHPLFLELLKKSEEEFGFRHDGAMHLPCNVAVFFTVLKKIEDENLMHHVKIARGPIGLTVL